ASRSSSRRSTTTTSTRSGASTSRSPQLPRTTSTQKPCCAASACRSLAWPSPHPKETKSSGQEIPSRESLAPAEVQGAELHALPPLRPPARGLSQVRPLSDLLARARARRLRPLPGQEAPAR